MAQIEVGINGRTYQIACDDGQEAHLTQLGEYVDKRVKELVTAVGQVGDSRLLVMVSLLIADELAETYADLKKTGAQMVDAEDAVSASSASAASVAAIEDKVAATIDAAAARIETLAAELSEG